MAVNIATVTTITRPALYRGQPTTSASTLYTSPAGTDTKITSIIICNTTSSSATLTLSVVPSGGTAGVTNQIFSSTSIGGSQTIVFDTPVHMTAGDFISGLQGTASALTLLISGETYA